MTQLSLQEALTYGRLQLASESSLRDPNTGALVSAPGPFAATLTQGNRHSLKFVPSDATKLAEKWSVLDHQYGFGLQRFAIQEPRR
jgi:hypothetical protein